MEERRQKKDAEWTLIYAGEGYINPMEEKSSASCVIPLPKNCNAV
jgi:hypothetical protein